MKRKLSSITLLLVLVFALIPMAAFAETISSNTAAGQGNLVVTGTIANFHGGDLKLVNTATGAVVHNQHYNSPAWGVEKYTLNYAYPNLPNGTYQVVWTGFGGTISIHF